MPSRRSRSHRHEPPERPLWCERVARVPWLGEMMVSVAMYRRNALGQGSVAPVPELLTPDPTEPGHPREGSHHGEG